MSEDQKIHKTYEGVQEIKIAMAKFIAYQEQHRKEIDELKIDVKNQRDNQNKFFGASSIIGFGLTAFFAWIFKHL